MKDTPILIVGKTAKTGLRVDQRLRDLGHVTRAVSRSTKPAFDWEDRSTWRQAMQGTTSAFVVFYPDLAIPSAEQAIRDFVAMAGDTGLRHVVMLSGRGEPGAERAESILMESGLEWNVVRASWFMQNFSEGFLIEGILNGQLALPADRVTEPFIDVDDIAEVAVATLTRPELRNRLIEVTGPRAVTFAEAVNEISRETGYPIGYAPISIDEFIEGLRHEGLPEQMLWLMRHLFSEVLDGRNSTPTNGVEEVLGRPATDFSEYVQKAVASGAWTRSGLLKQA